MARFVPNAVVRLIVAHNDLLIGKAGELVEEKGETCIVDFGVNNDPKDYLEVDTNILESVDAEDEYDDDDPDVMLGRLLTITKPFHDQITLPDPTSDDEGDLNALEELLSKTEPFKSQMDSAARKDWKRISAEVADLRSGNVEV